MPNTPDSRLRSSMRKGCVALPGAFNGLVARAVARAGFDGCYVSGAAVSASYGVPDIGLATLDVFCNVIEQVARSSGLPVLADADTGFGEGEELIRRVVREYARAGAAGFHIEDQVFPKRCGHLDGKTLITSDNMCAKVLRAAAARDEMVGKGIEASRQRGIEQNGKTVREGFIVCARTDARGIESFDSALDRARAYTEAGADMIFPEGLASEDEFARFASDLRTGAKDTGLSRHGGPFLLANMTEFGKTPIIPLARFEQMGYDCVIFPVTTLRAAMHGVDLALRAIREHGHVEGVLDRMQHRKDLYALLGYTPGEEWVYPGPTRPATEA